MDHSQCLLELLVVAFFSSGRRQSPQERIPLFLEEMGVEVVMELYKTVVGLQGVGSKQQLAVSSGIK